MQLKGSKTEANLMTAFAGESQAYTKYGYYSSKAKKEGYNELAAVFAETAGNEKEHAKIWFKLLHDGMPDTLTNLADAAAGENYEWTDMYDGFAKTAEQISANKAMKALGEFLRPEFLGRVDEVIAFKPLTEETLQGIAALMLDEYKPGMEAKGIAYSYTPAALKALVQKSQGGRFGARDLRRTIRKAVEDPAAERLIDGTLASGGTLVVDADENGEIILK